jgi:competence protein CoiA
MIIKAGLIVAAHFAHKSTCPTDYKSHPESPEHRAGKILVAECLRANVGEYSTALIEYEVPIPEVRRVADVLVTFPMGWRVAHEVQLASITTEELAQRTEDYLHAGVDVVWWLGKSADTPANRDWCQRVLGFSLSIHLEASGFEDVGGAVDLAPFYAR